MERLPSLPALYLLRTLTIVAYAQVSTTLTASGFLLLGIGLFLVFHEFQRRLPGARPWISIGGVAVLTGGLVIAGIGLVYFVLAQDLYSFAFQPTIPQILIDVLSDVLWFAEITLGVGVLLALLGVMRGLILEQPTAAGPRPP